jgi:putative ABC transport system permease protein
MIANYFKTAYRHLVKTKSYSLINIFGLMIGMTACLLILHYVHYERSYDAFHKNSDRIYRLRYERTSEAGTSTRFASCCPPAGAIIRERYPEVEKLARLFKYNASVSFGDIKFYEDRIFFAAPEFVEIFDFKFTSGDPRRDLAQPNNAFLSESIARKYFGDRDPVGETITLDQKTDYRVVGLFEDIPQNSHVKLDILLPLENLISMYGDEYMLAWGHTGLYTYLLLKAGADAQAFEAKLPALVNEQWGEVLRDYNMSVQLKMQPLKAIHLTSHFMQEFESNGNKEAVRYLFVIALFIIVIAWVNYINLSTARSMHRAKEVGLRKVVGATRRHLIIQFFFETLIINLIALALTFILLKMVLPAFHHLVGIAPEHGLWAESWFWQWAAILYVGGVLLSGFYPVLAITAFKITSVIHGGFASSRHGIYLRKALVVFQFAMATVLLISTFTIYRQLAYMHNQDVGFDMEQVLVIKSPRVRPASVEDSFNNFKETLLKLPGVHKVCHVTEVPGRQIIWDAGAIKRAGEDDSKSKNYQIVGIDYGFMDVFDVKLISGRNFSKEFPADDKSLILNETAVQWMGFEDKKNVVGQQVDYWGEIFTIVGVMKDFHQQSLKEAYEPHIYRLMPTGRGVRGQFAVKLDARNTGDTIDKIRSTYTGFFPGNPFDYFFLDEYYDQQYKAEVLFGRVFQLFSTLSVLITALGLFGLASFHVVQRTREIGIRKVLGASISGIVMLLSKEYVKWILLSTLIAWPVGWYAMHKWLQNFAFHTNPGVIAFAISLALTLGVALLTVAFQVIRAAMANPVEALRYE